MCLVPSASFWCIWAALPSFGAVVHLASFVSQSVSADCAHAGGHSRTIWANMLDCGLIIGVSIIQVTRIVELMEPEL